MKTKLLWGVGLVVAFLLMLLVTAPATLVTRTVSGLAPVSFSGVSGSLWRGEALRLHAGSLVLENFRWQLSPWRLFLGQAAVQFELGDGVSQRGSGTVVAGLGGDISVQELSLQAPAQLLQPFVTLPGIQFDGNLQLDIADAALSGARVERMQGRLVWLQAQVRTPLGQPRLGAYAVDLGSDGEGGMTGDITDIDGVLGLTGRLRASPQGLELDGSVRSDLPEELDRFFRVIGRPEGDRYAIRWQQQFGG